MLGDQVLGQLRPLWLTPADLLAVEALRAAISRAFAGLGAPGDLLVVRGARPSPLFSPPPPLGLSASFRPVTHFIYPSPRSLFFSPHPLTTAHLCCNASLPPLPP